MAIAKLSAKQLAFVENYLIDFNGTQAAIRAGYAGRAAKVQASVLLTKPNILAELAARREKQSTALQITANDVLQMLQREAGAGDLDVPNAARIKAQELIGKHVGMFSDKNTGQNSGAGPTQILIQFGGGEPQALTDSQHTDRLIESEQEADNGE